MLLNKALAPAPRSHAFVFWMWLLAAALGLVGEEALLKGHPAASAGLFILGVTLAIVGDRSGGPPEDVGTLDPLALSRESADPSRRLPGYALLSSGVICVAFATLDEAQDGATASSGWVWGIGLLLAACGGYLLLAGRSLSEDRDKGRRRLEFGGVAILVAIAFLLRFSDLAATPFQVHGDEATIGLEARRILAGAFPDPFSVGWFDVPFLSFAIPAAFLRYLGNDLFALRLASVVQGVGSIALLYVLVRRLFSPRVAFMAAFLMTVAHWHIHYSRTGFHYMQAVFVILLLFWLFERGLQKRDAFSFMLAGFAVGLCVLVYYSARVAPVILVVYVAHRAVTEAGFLRTHRRGLVILGLSAALFIAPVAAFFSAHPGALNSRGRQVFLLDRTTLAQEYSETGFTRLEDLLAAQTRAIALAFNRGTDMSLQYGFKGPLLDGWTAALMVLGVAIIILRWRSSNYFLIAAWLFLPLLLGGVLTIDAPFSPRILTALPPLLIAAALAIDSLWQATQRAFGQTGKFVLLAAVVILGLVIGRANYVDYFDEFAGKTHRYDAITEAAYFMAGLPSDNYVLYLNAEATIGYETARFLAPNVRGEDRSAEFGRPSLRTDDVEGQPVFLLLGEYMGKLDELRQRYPGGETIAGPGTPTRYIAYIPPP
jgi:4-amino-4-deoxy-L-arabinose transferase-like glycosyltransferase